MRCKLPPLPAGQHRQYKNQNPWKVTEEISSRHLNASRACRGGRERLIMRGRGGIVWRASELRGNVKHGEDNGLLTSNEQSVKVLGSYASSGGSHFFFVQICLLRQQKVSTASTRWHYATKHKWSGNDQRWWESSAPAVSLRGRNSAPSNSGSSLKQSCQQTDITLKCPWARNESLMTSGCCFVADTDTSF